MTVYRLRAEYADAASSRPTADGAPAQRVKCWHMVRAGAPTALCGRDVVPQAPTRSEDAWGTTTEPVCHTCGALYLRQVP